METRASDEAVGVGGVGGVGEMTGKGDEQPHMANYSSPESLKLLGFRLVQEVLATIRSNRPTDWDRPYPQIGNHYFTNDIH